MPKTVRLIFKSGATAEVPYTYKFYKELTENMGKDSIAVHKQASIKTKELQAVVFQQTPRSDE